jgi:hypothetical protein
MGSQAIVKNVFCENPNPLSSGGTKIVREVTLRCAISGVEVSLSSEAGEGNFGIDVRAEGSDALGQAPQGVNPSPLCAADFLFDTIVMGAGSQRNERDGPISSWRGRVAAVSEVSRYTMSLTAARSIATRCVACH